MSGKNLIYEEDLREFILILITITQKKSRKWSREILVIINSNNHRGLTDNIETKIFFVKILMFKF